ncbi:DUF4232 domain-containing protein [Streptomyces sp. NPDC091268]|uniref:DUF4232 domain-containing protein n=1 Tax=Streptomyces sp. NPDC091268 TaxID=3365979 RepID=UPI00381B0CDC
MRVFRRTTHARTLGALGLAAAALLTATACEPSDDKAGSTPPPKSSPSAPTPSAAASTTPPASPAATPAPSSSPSRPGRPGEAEGEPTGIDGNCPDENVRVKVEWAVPPAKDDSKLLLVMTNVGGEACKLRTYPVLRLEDGHGRLVGVFENSKPQTEVVLAPGKEAYAGLLLRQGNKNAGTFVKDLALSPPGERATDNTGSGLLLQMPQGGVSMDDKARVTYWNSSSEAAVSPLFPH